MSPHMQPFFLALKEILLAGDPKPQRKPLCSACLDTGDTEYGRPCPLCGDRWDGVCDGETD